MATMIGCIRSHLDNQGRITGNGKKARRLWKKMILVILGKTNTMANIDTAAAPGSKRKTRPFPRIDMTPMVDLGFLLITFFIFTTSMSESKAMKLVMPADGDGTKSMATATLSVLLDSNRVYAYHGMWETALQAGAVQATSLNTYTGLGASIRSVRQALRARGYHDSDLVLLIKPTARADYKQVIDALDEALIYEVKRYAIVEPDGAENAWCASRK
ncbi:MAG: biopolymer transporter ExbD [Sphingobacteriales bacterium]|nr:MAG: biopolymer transporter ExbD [Sphingobacteriales bacterium]